MVPFLMVVPSSEQHTGFIALVSQSCSFQGGQCCLTQTGMLAAQASESLSFGASSLQEQFLSVSKCVTNLHLNPVFTVSIQKGSSFYGNGLSANTYLFAGSCQYLTREADDY